MYVAYYFYWHVNNDRAYRQSAIVRFGVIGSELYIFVRPLPTADVFLAYGTVDFAGQVFGCHAVPLFHGMGAFEIAIAVSGGAYGSFWRRLKVDMR